jgi:hypothetical protein
MFHPLEVKALSDYRIWVRFADGVEGEVDLSRLAGRGVFSSWQDYKVFQQVRIGPGGEIAWSEEMELCPDSLYLQITGKAPEDAFPNLARAAVSA